MLTWNRDTPNPLPQNLKSEVDSFYKFHYALGLDRLFETSWYSSRGLAHLEGDSAMQDFVSQCAEQFKMSSDHTAKPLRSLEARLVWTLASMPRAAASNANGAGNDPLLQELLPRVETVENLLTGQFLEQNRIPPPPQQPGPSQPHQDHTPAHQKYNEQSFWHNLARFASIRDDHPATVKEVNDALNLLRGILNMLENRDVLYSVAVARHIGGRLPDFNPQRHVVASSNDPNDDMNRLKVAKQFVELEDQRGTTQVIQRVCSMAIRSWGLQKQ